MARRLALRPTVALTVQSLHVIVQSAQRRIAVLAANQLPSRKNLPGKRRVGVRTPPSRDVAAKVIREGPAVIDGGSWGLEILQKEPHRCY